MTEFKSSTTQQQNGLLKAAPYLVQVITAKGTFVIQGSITVRSSIDDVTSLIDNYENNATYSNRALHRSRRVNH